MYFLNSGIAFNQATAANWLQHLKYFSNAKLCAYDMEGTGEIRKGAVKGRKTTKEMKS